MADNEIHINIKGPSELKIQISIGTDKTVLDLKRAIADKSDVEADRQRLIYSGRVLKDEDLLSVYKIQSSHTIHMVKGSARPAPSGSSNAPPPQIPTMQAGQNPADPLTLLNGYMGHGLMAGFNPFTELGINQHDPNMLQTMMQSPEFLQQMSSLMSNPAILDQIIALNPQLAAAGPQMRQVFQSEQFRQMVSNPETLRTMMQMSAMMRGAGLGDGALGTAPGAFPAPGVPSSVGGTGAVNPTSPSSTTPASVTGTGASAPPYNPALLQALMSGGAFGGLGGAPGGLGGAPGGFGGAPGGFGGAPGGFGGLGGLGGGLFGAPPAAAPADSRPPEERFQVQLQQLQDMGFTNAAQNVRALLATNGNVHAAIEYILGGGGL
ncbi:ubiquitin-domain-containing protein [Boletus coccyginus]|nr:ubiquitin-domain-containing protein [Boletus coccyginus]